MGRPSRPSPGFHQLSISRPLIVDGRQSVTFGGDVNARNKTSNPEGFMARLLEPELNNFEDDSLEGKLFGQQAPTDEMAAPFSQEWFRAHPQWTTDRLIKPGSLLD